MSFQNPTPDADKLNICQVDLGEDEPVQIVCGAPNVDEGQYVIVAKVGGRLPGGVKIKRAKLRGERSEGMICSLQEIGISSHVTPKAFENGISSSLQKSHQVQMPLKRYILMIKSWNLI